MTNHLAQKKIKNLCKDEVDSSFPLHSRVHKMQTLDLSVKREDELGFGVSGSKLRKYSSILPNLRQKKEIPIALVGSPYSNHVLSFLQLLKQEGFSYRLFLEKPHLSSPPKGNLPKGNFFYLSLLAKQEEIIWIDKVPDFLDLDWTRCWEEKLQQTFTWIPLGGCMVEAFAGSLTLCLDILENEKELGFAFDHIFVDAGTGMMAAALILGMSYLQKKTKIHVVLIGGTKESFQKQLDFFSLHLQQLVGAFEKPLNYELLFPVTAKSFGSCNKTVLKQIQETAQKEGFFLDPIYTAKLLVTTKETLINQDLQGRILWIHSGGALSLTGFSDVLGGI